jgi:hypothetical protein
MRAIAVDRLAASPRVDEWAVPLRAPIVAVLAGSGAIGVFAGAVWQPIWQDGVEPAQVLAGLVSYPPGNPVYLYSVHTWTVVHQLSAALLSAGVSERAISLLLNGLMGMVALQALGLIVLALSHDVLLAVVSPFFILLTHTASGGVTYPIALLGVPWTYGILGVSYALLTIGLFGVGRDKAAAVLLGFGPAVHVTIGSLMVIVVALAAVLDRSFRASIKATAPWFVGGAAAALASATVHVLHHVAPTGTWSVGYVQGLGAHWDEHRQPFPLLAPGALAAYFAVVVPALWLARYAGDLAPHARLLLRLLLVSAAIGGVLSVSYWIVPPEVPSVVATLMPSRLLNLSGTACMALLLGLSPRYSANPLVRATLVIMVVGLVALAGVLPRDDDGTIQKVVGWSAMAVYAALVASVAERWRRESVPHRPAAWLQTRARLLTIGAIMAALVGVAAVASREFGSALEARLADRTSDDLYAAAAQRPGLLLTSSRLHLIQLVTRRPVLLDGGAIDALLYVPAAAGETDRILRRVYGIDLQRVRTMRRGFLADETGKTLWESRTADEWRAIAREFGVTDVLTYAEWRLQLPVVASNADLVLYAIPADPLPQAGLPF